MISLKMDSCDKCNAECCRYVTAPLKKPKDKNDWDEIKWLLMHKGVIIYQDEDGDWNLEVKTDCRHLDEKTKKCRIYDKRPSVCKDHEAHECEATGEFSDTIFKKPEDVDEYLG